MENSSFYPRSNGYRNDAERLRFVIRATSLSSNAFARKIGLPDGEELYRIICNKAPITPALVARIRTYVPQIDAGWLLTGEVGHRPGDGPTETWPPHEQW